jgi:hypothetical protein
MDTDVLTHHGRPKILVGLSATANIHKTSSYIVLCVAIFHMGSVRQVRNQPNLRWILAHNLV